MQLYTIFYKILPFMKMHLPTSFILSMLGLRWMCMHLWLNLVKRTIDIQEKKKKGEICTKSMESCPLVISHILAEFHPEKATYTTLHNHLNGLSKSAQNFYDGFLKLLSIPTPIHIVVWGQRNINIAASIALLFKLHFRILVTEHNTWLMQQIQAEA